MPWQLVYTSAPRGLVSGQSGFCTVGRSADLREALAQRLERISSYHFLDAATASARLHDAAAAQRNPIISAYRTLDLRGSKYHVLSRLQPSGLDFTARTNHLAHHLVFQPEELSRLPSPAVILRHWKGWLAKWEGEPRLLDALSVEDFAGLERPRLPARSWLQATGDAGRAAGLLEAEYARGCYLAAPPGGEEQLLVLFGETLELAALAGKNPQRAWQYTLTTFLQGEDAAADFQWRGCRPDTPASDQALRRGALLTELAGIRVPNIPLTQIAREGNPTSPAVPASDASQRRIPLRTRAAQTAQSPRRATSPTSASATAGKSSRDSNSEGISINIGLLQLIGILAILVLLPLGILFRLHKWPFRPAPVPQSSPANRVEPPGTPAVQPTPAAQAASASASAAAVSKPAERPEPAPDLVRLDQFLDLPTYVALVRDFESELLPLGQLKPLKELLERVAHFGVKCEQIHARFCRDSWLMSAKIELVPSCHGWELDLAGGGNDLGEQVNLGFELVDDTLLQARIRPAKKEIRMYSILFEVSAPENQPPPYRVLIVNESLQPQPWKLDKSFLDLNATSPTNVLKSPLRERLQALQFAPGVRLQYRPFVGTPPVYLYSGWENAPAENAVLDFAAATNLFNRELSGQKQKLTQCQANLVREKKNLLPAGLDVPLGEIVGSTNAALKNFAAFARKHPDIAATNAAAVYLNYLGKVSEHTPVGRKEKGQWSPNLRAVEASLQNLASRYFARYSKKEPEEPIKADDLIEAWRSLDARDKQIQQHLQEERQLGRQIEDLDKRQNTLPKNLNDVTQLRIYIVHKDRALEFIRFAD